MVYKKNKFYSSLSEIPNNFDINDSDNDNLLNSNFHKKTPIEWFGVTFFKENKNFDTHRNSHEFKINLINESDIRI